MSMFQNQKSKSFLLAAFLLSVITLGTGCSTTPVKQKWPAAPKSALESCPELDKLTNDSKLSDISKTINTNYSRYHECAVKVNAWIEWYKTQKSIHEGKNK